MTTATRQARDRHQRGFDATAMAAGGFDDLPADVQTEILDRITGPDYRHWERQAARCGYCARPVRLAGRVTHDGREVYNSANEPEGVLLKRCGNRRASVCPSCSFLYAGDMWQLLYAGVAGGRKGVPAEVATHPMVFVTLTAPSFGPVHSQRERNGQPQRCRPRREGQLCPHGRRLWCMATHKDGDPHLGQALCPDCHDYDGAVLFNYWASELWRRFRIALDRVLARRLGCRTRDDVRGLLRLSYGKVAELQTRGLVHFHAIFRLDGPGDAYAAPIVNLTTDELGDVIKQAAASVHIVRTCSDTQAVEVRFGAQTDVRAITGWVAAEVGDGAITAEKVAAYLAKYSIKGAEDFGLGARPLTADTARALGLSGHTVRMVDTCNRLAATLPKVNGRLAKVSHMLGYRGHFHSKSRHFSTTLGALRRPRADYCRQRNAGQQNRPVRPLGCDEEASEAVEVIAEWQFAGIGYSTTGDAVLAAASAAAAREWRLSGEVAA